MRWFLWLGLGAWLAACGTTSDGTRIDCIATYKITGSLLGDND